MSDILQSTHIVKVLSGPHQGAEVAIGEGDLSVGSSLESDLILSDTLISPSHLKISIQKEEITLSTLGHKVYLNGYLLPEGTKRINAFDYITLGSTHLVIGPHAGSWPVLSPPSLSDLKDTVVAAAAHLEPEPETNEPAELAQVPQSPADSTPREELKAHPANNPPILAPFLVGFSVLVFLGVLGFVIFYPSNRSMDTSALLDEKQVEKAKSLLVSFLDDRDIPADTFKFEYKNQQLYVSGLVETNKQKRDLEKGIRSLMPYYKVSIGSQESLVITCRELLNLLNASVSVSAVGPGVVKVSGYIANPAIWENAKKSLLNDTPGLIDVVDKVTTSQELSEISFSILNRYQIAQQVSLFAEPSQVAARGNLPESSRKIWYEAKMDLEKALGGQIPFLDAVSFDTMAEKIYLDARIESVTITDTLKWVSLQNGKTYFEGSTIPSGYTIERIAREGVTLRRGKDHITLKIGEK